MDPQVFDYEFGPMILAKAGCFWLKRPKSGLTSIRFAACLGWHNGRIICFPNGGWLRLCMARGQSIDGLPRRGAITWPLGNHFLLNFKFKDLPVAGRYTFEGESLTWSTPRGDVRRR